MYYDGWQDFMSHFLKSIYILYIRLKTAHNSISNPSSSYRLPLFSVHLVSQQAQRQGQVAEGEEEGGGGECGGGGGNASDGK